jgi:hypothetical protein
MGLLFIPQVIYMSMENHGGKILTANNSQFVHLGSQAILPALSSSSKAGETGEGNNKVCHTKYLSHSSKVF